MSTAVIISGNTRTFARCYKSQKWHIYRKLEDPHFFCSMVDEPGCQDIELLKADYPAIFEYRTQPDLQPTPEMIAALDFAPYGNSVTPDKYLRWMWQMLQAWQLFLVTGKGPTWNQFMRVRPDSFIHRFDLPIERQINTIYLPWWGSYGGINDRMAFITSIQCADVYFTAIDRVGAAIKAGCPCHPESLMAAVLELAGLRRISRTLNAEFTTLRAKGDDRPDAQPVYYAGDIFRYAEARWGQTPHAR